MHGHRPWNGYRVNTGVLQVVSQTDGLSGWPVPSAESVDGLLGKFIVLHFLSTGR